MYCVLNDFIRREREIDVLSSSKAKFMQKVSFVLLMCFYCCISRLYIHICVCICIHFLLVFLQAWAAGVGWLLTVSAFLWWEKAPLPGFHNSEDKVEWAQLLYRWESPNVDSSHLVPESFFLHCLKYLGWKDKSGWNRRGIRMEWIPLWTGPVDAALSYWRLGFGSQLWWGQAEPWVWLSSKPAECWLLAYMFTLSSNLKKTQTPQDKKQNRKNPKFLFCWWTKANFVYFW